MKTFFPLLILLFSAQVVAEKQSMSKSDALYWEAYSSQKEHIGSNKNSSSSIINMSKEKERNLLDGCRAATKLYANNYGGDDAIINAGQCLAIFEFKMFAKILSERMRPKNNTDKEMLKAMKYVNPEEATKEAITLAAKMLSAE